MTGRSFDVDELLQLLGAVRDEHITPEQVARLENIISQDSEARRFYLRFLTIHGLLEQAAVAMPVEEGAVLPAKTTARPEKRSWAHRYWPIAAVAAAVMIAVSTWWLLSTPSDNKNREERIALAWRVTPTSNARFEHLTPNSLRLERGEVRIEAVKAEPEPGQVANEFAPMTVATPAGKVTVDGSDFLVGAHDAGHLPMKGAREMKQLTRVLVLAGMATLINQHGSITGESNSLLAAEPGQAPAKEMVLANTGFAVDMYRQLAKQEGGKNLFFSPYSISIALAMAAEGARGETAAEMGNVLHFPRTARRIGDDAQLIPWQTALIHTGLAQISRDLARLPKQQAEPFVLRIANALWAERTYPFRPQFLKTLNDSYGTGAAFPCDFVNDFERERVRINTWVADQTNQRIENLLPADAVTKLTRMVLTNAIYFKGDWVQQFAKRSTRPEDFTTLAGTRVKTPMMSGQFKHARFAYVGAGDPSESLEQGKADHFRLVELPYKGGLAMVLIAPDNVRGLPRLEAQLTTDNLDKWLGRLRAEEKVEIRMPRFKLTSGYELPNALRQLGMMRAFRMPGPDGADFSGMSDSQDLYISGVHHKAFVAVNEEGTEAAAATGVAIALGGPPKLPPTFAGDRPFLFLIRDPASKTILFMGRITDATGIANHDRTEAQERGLKIARTTPTKHPLHQRLKNAAGVAVIRLHRDPNGIRLDSDSAGRLILPCRVALSLKGTLKTDSVATLTIAKQVQESESGQEFLNFFNKSASAVLAVYQREGGQWVVTDIIEIDEEARLIASNLFSIPIDRLSALVRSPGKDE